MKTRRDVFQAIADPTRRSILVLLASQVMTPNAIAEEFKTSRQAVSNHIKILTECKLLKQEQKGREIYYHINADKVKEIDNWIEQFRNILQTQFNQLDNVLIKLKKQRN
jgi:DNA-binding transcriptional ArsR family regulator